MNNAIQLVMGIFMTVHLLTGMYVDLFTEDTARSMQHLLWAILFGVLYQMSEEKR